MIRKFLINCLFIIFMFVCLYTTICYATPITVTEENLDAAFQKFVSSEANENNYKISVSNNIITITSNDGNYTLNYDLTDKPTFTLAIPIEKGMSYDDFKKQTDNLILPMLGYIAVANIQGVQIEDASAYFLFSYLESALNNSCLSENSYMIVDDLNLSEGASIEKNDNPKTIYASEFGDRVMEYVNDTYKDKQSITDSTGINSYVFTVEKQDTTDTSCKLVSTLSVNLDADFSKLNGYANNMDAYKDITETTADYVVKLKVGQKCEIISSEKIAGYEFFGSSCIEFNDDNSIITAVKKGTVKGYLYVGDSNNKKSIYFIVEENTGNESLETVKLTINSTPNNGLNNNNNYSTNKSNNIATDTDTTVSATRLPKAGMSPIIILIVSISIFTTILIVIKLRKLKEVK